MVHPAEGRAPHARKDGMTQTRTRLLLVVAQWHAPGDYDMPRFASGLTMRTRRAHPSEKTALRVISGLFPQGHPSLEGPPPEGRAPHAPNIGIAAYRGMSPLGNRAFARPRSLCYSSARVRPCHTDAETASLVCIILLLLGDSVLGAGRGVPDADASLGR